VTSVVRQWYFQPYLTNGNRGAAEVPLSFTFSIQDPSKPAYLHLTNGDTIRADEVREFTDGIEYTADQHAHRIPTDSVRSIDRCVPSLVESGCVPGGGPSFNIRAIPLLPAAKERPKLQISVFNPLFDKGCWDTSN